MGNKIEIQLPFLSRHKKTELYTKNGKVFYGVWQKPNIVIDGDERIVDVAKNDEGNLNLISFREYNTPDLFWAIALVNGIKNPVEDVVAGLRLVIPKYENILAALSDELL